MSDDATLIANLFRDLSKSLDDVSRRVANSHMTGTVAAKKGNMVRLELLPTDERTGKPFLSPWVQLQDAAGGTASHTPVEIGDPMRLLSPSGEIGPASIAVRDSHVQDKPNPASSPEELVLQHAGNELRMRDGSMLLKQGETQVELTAAGVRINGDLVDITGAGLTHNQTNVGDSHVHGGVTPGADTTANPV